MEQKPKTESQTTSSQLIEPTDGLVLTGLVVSIEENKGSYDGRNYHSLIIAISTGDKTMFATFSADNGPLPYEIKPFTRIRVNVGYTKTEKGKISVSGDYEILK